MDQYFFNDISGVKLNPMVINHSLHWNITWMRAAFNLLSFVEIIINYSSKKSIYQMRTRIEFYFNDTTKWNV
jgi:hypothetical protein